MSMQERVYDENVSAAAAGTSQESNVSPFFQGANVKFAVEVSDDFAGTWKFEQSDDNSTWSDLWAPGAQTAAAGTPNKAKVIAMPKYVRFNLTARTAGSVVKASAYSGV